MYNRDLAGTRFSTLQQITTANVGTLKKAWTYQLQPATGNINPAPALASEMFNEVTPIVVNGVMYMPSGNRVGAATASLCMPVSRLPPPTGHPCSREPTACAASSTT